MDSCIRIGTTLLTTIVKLVSKNNSSEILIEGMSDVVDLSIDDFFARREINRKKQEIIDNISKSCYKVLDYYPIEKNRATQICEVIAKTIEKTGITYEDILIRSITADQVTRLFLENTFINQEDYNELEWELLNRLFRHAASIIINGTIESPQFVNHGIQFLSEKFLEFEEKLNEILEAVNEIDEITIKKKEDFQRYERIYRDNVKNKYEWIQLLGVKNLSREEKRYRLSIAYVLHYSQESRHVF